MDRHAADFDRYVAGPDIDDTLVPGYYELAEDIENPLHDRRHKNDLPALPVIPKGTRVSVRRVHSGVADYTLLYLRLRGLTRYTTDIGPGTHPDLYESLCAALVPVPVATLSEARSHHEIEAWELSEVAERLIRDGRLSVDELISIVDDVRNAEEE